MPTFLFQLMRLKTDLCDVFYFDEWVTVTMATFLFQLMRLKTDLRDVLYSHKWTPDAYLLAKAYVAEDDAREAADQSRLPRLQLKNPTRKL